MKRFLYMALGLLLAAPVLAQISSGNIFGTITDEQGAVLTGVTVTLSGDQGTRTSTTGSNGEFRFLNLDNGSYKLTVGLTGFAKSTRTVRVTTGENVNLSFTLKVATVEETVQVVADTPLVDVKKRGTSTTLISDELEKTPNARDPWGILKNVPGVVVDRVNIAGNSNGQQADAGSHGSVGADKMWNLDGVVITDMSAAGASPSYFDFDAFQEIAITTGGADLNVQTGGIGINLVTKRGTNKFHGGGRFLFAGNGLQSSNLPSSLATDPRLKNADGSFRDNADHIDSIKDYGFDL
ncbi:MAG TPA: carboxypeptidase-like regulatory domain-containing protein, partial [Vicinamibacteria bacterium]|nr:carboxypeptidase-like regulatory domain-containing protein [Vicinamibacteria bacterium]